MSMVHQDTIRLERDFPVPPNRVFDAYADPRKRVRWVVPSPQRSSSTRPRTSPSAAATSSSAGRGATLRTPAPPATSTSRRMR